MTKRGEPYQTLSRLWTDQPTREILLAQVLVPPFRFRVQMAIPHKKSLSF